LISLIASIALEKRRGEIANWEMASGLPARQWIAWFYVPITFTVGWFIAPGKMRAAFSAGRGRNNLYKLRIERDQMMKMKIGDLRKLLDAPRQSRARQSSRDFERVASRRLSRGKWRDVRVPSQAWR
jgi:hypothetical protein